MPKFSTELVSQLSIDESAKDWSRAEKGLPPLLKGQLNEEVREVLLDVLENTNRFDKIKVVADPITKNVTLIYEDIDEEWFKKLGIALKGG